mgnify:CR=1 FL=1
MDTNLSNSKIKAWCIGQVLNKPKQTIFIAIIATLLMGSGISFLVIDDDMMKMLPNDLKSKRIWDAVQSDFGSTDIIFIAYGKEGELVYNPKLLADLWILSEKLEELSSVQNISNISTSTRIDQVDGFMEIDDLQKTQHLTDNEIESIRLYLEKNQNVRKQLVSKDQDYLLTIIQPSGDIGLDKFRNDIVALGDSILANYEIHYGGTAYVTGSIPQMIRDDVQSLIKIGLVIMIIILLVNLRSLPAVGMVMTVIVFSLVAMIGFMGWAFRFTGSEKFLFALLNTSMPIILLTIANSDGVHVMTKFFREIRMKKDVEKAIVASMDALLAPIFLTSITTIAAFLTMSTSPLEPLVGYGVCISIGIAWAWLLSSFVLPALISLKTWDLNSKEIISLSIFEKLIGKIGSIIVGYPKAIFLSGVLLVTIGFTGLHKVIVDVNISSFFKPGTDIRDSMDFMDREMSGTMDMRVRIMGDIKDPPVLKAIDSLQSFIKQNKRVTASFSVADIVKQMHRTVMGDSIRYESIPNEREKVNNLFTMYSMSGDPDDFSNIVDYNYSTALITAFTSAISTKEVFAFVNDISDYVKDQSFSSITVDVTGMIIVIRDMVTLVIRSSFFSIFISLVLITVITALFFKRLLWGMIAVLPLTGAIILNFGLMGHFDITLNHVTAILSSIIIGVGVDFAIHFISQFRYMSLTADKLTISKSVINDVGYPIILDAGSNMAFGSLLFSAFLPVQYIGGLMVFAMVSTSLGTLTLLATTTELLKNRLIRKES